MNEKANEWTGYSDYFSKNSKRLKIEMGSLRLDREELFKREPKEFHQLIQDQYKHRVRGHIIRDLSLNFGIDYETSASDLEGKDLIEILELGE